MIRPIPRRRRAAGRAEISHRSPPVRGGRGSSSRSQQQRHRSSLHMATSSHTAVHPYM
jgi:hypothetical protein